MCCVIGWNMTRLHFFKPIFDSDSEIIAYTCVVTCWKNPVDLWTSADDLKKFDLGHASSDVV